MVSADIAIFARLPVLGKVKTRLASGLGPEKAVQFYTACAEHIFRECSRCITARATVFFSSDSDLPDARKWLAATGLVRTAGVRRLCAQEASWFEYALQALPCAAQAKDQDLGVRMYSALASLLAQDHTSKVGLLAVICSSFATHGAKRVCQGHYMSQHKSNWTLRCTLTICFCSPANVLIRSTVGSSGWHRHT